MSPPGVQFQSFNVGNEVAADPPAPVPNAKFRAGQGLGGGRPTKGCKTCDPCKLARSKKNKVDPAMCLSNKETASVQANEPSLDGS